MSPQRSIVITCLFFLQLSCATSTTLFTAIPKGDSEFNLASDELIDQYADIKKYHSAYMQPFQAKPELSALEKQWGQPDHVQNQSDDMLAALFTGATIGVIAVPASWMVLPVMGTSYVIQAVSPSKRVVWEKGDYQVEAITKRSKGKALMDSWSWRYKGVEEYVPILGARQRRGNYYIATETGRSAEFLLGEKNDYDRNVLISLGKKIPSEIANLDFLIDIGWQWHLGKVNSESYQWISYPVRMIPSYRFVNSRTTLGLGVVSTFSNALVLEQNRYTANKIEPGLVLQTGYQFSQNFQLGLSITSTKTFQFQSQSFNLGVVNSFVNLYF